MLAVHCAAIGVVVVIRLMGDRFAVDARRILRTIVWDADVSMNVGVGELSNGNGTDTDD